jgi:hypothetical protein
MEMPETPAAFIRENHFFKKNGKIPPARMIPEDTKKRSINSPRNRLISMDFQQPAPAKTYMADYFSCQLHFGPVPTVKTPLKNQVE